MGNIVVEAAGTPITDAIGYFGEPVSTNKCTNYNANPDSGAVTPTDLATFNAAGVTGVTATGGDGSSLFGVVSDTTELAAAGLDALCTDGLVLKIDNTSGAAAAYLTFSPVTGNTNDHAITAWIRNTGDTARLRLINGSDIGDLLAVSVPYRKVETLCTNVVGTDIARVQANPGAVVYFILNQLEEKAFSTSEIITEGSAVTRNKDDLSYPTTNIPVNDCVFSFDWTPTAAGQGTIGLTASGVSADYLSIFVSGATFFARKRLSSVNYDATKTLSYVSGTTYSIKVRFSSVDGVDAWIDDAKATGASNTDDLILDAQLQVGANHESLLPQTGGINNFTVYKGNFTDAEVIAL